MSDRIVSVKAVDKRFEMAAGAGSDSLHVDPTYSYAMTLIEIESGNYGTGLAFTIGRGNEVVVKAIEAFAPFVVENRLESIMRELGRFWRSLADESQLRWLGPQKGAIHLALASVTSALVDAWCRRMGKPLWQVLMEMTPEELMAWVDLTYLDDYLTRDEALGLLRTYRTSDWSGHELLTEGYPAYNTSVGWLGYDLESVVAKSREAVAEGFGAIKIKVGSAQLTDDVERVRAVREAAGPDVRIMTDANQKWSVDEAIAAGRALRELDCFWIEEPTHPDDVLGFQRIAREIAPLRVAGGEHVANAVLFKNLIAAGGLHFVQADIVRLGGLPEFLAVMLMARKAGLPVVPHAGETSQIHQHMVVWQSIMLGVEPYPLEYIPHLKDVFETPIRVEGGRYQLPRAAGASTRMVDVAP